MRERAVLVLILLLAFALRVYRLDGQSFWSDEFISLQRSSQPLAEMLTTMPPEHAPLYFVVLHFWMAGAGAASDFGLRTLSVAFSLLAVALGYRLGRRLLGREGGLWTAFLLAANPFQVWYAQEARMYAMALALGLASVDGLLTLLKPAGTHETWQVWLRGAWYALITAAMLYTHYYGFLLLAVEWAYAAWTMWRRDRAVWRRFAATQLAVALLFLPWLPRLGELFGFPGWRPPLDVADLPWRYLAIYSLGTSLPADAARWLSLGYLLLGVGGVAWLAANARAPSTLLDQKWILPGNGLPPTAGSSAGARPAINGPGYQAAPLEKGLWKGRSKPDSAGAAVKPGRFIAGRPSPSDALALIGCYLGVWFLAGVLLALLKPDFHERYFIMLTPGLYLAMAAGAEAFRQAFRPQVRWAPTLAVAGFVLVTGGWSLSHHYFDPAYAKPDYRSMARTIYTRGTSDDAVILNGPERAYLARYYPGPPLEQANLAGSRYQGKEDEARARLADLASRHDRMWLAVEFRGPDYVKEWLDRNGYLVERFTPQDITLYLYSFPRETGALRQPDALRKSGPVALDGYALAPNPVPAGQVAHLTLRWRAEEAVPADYKVALRVVDAGGRERIAVDRVPVDGFAPTSSWQPGQVIEDHYGLRVPGDMPPGRYPVQLKMYQEGTWAEVLSATLGPLEVVEP